MNPKYSILLCNQSLAEYAEKIDKWLHQGIKIIWFGNEEDVKTLKEKYEPFAKALLLQAYVTTIKSSGVIVDGKGERKLFEMVADSCKFFNSAQYEIEHCRQNANIVVQASAGTGKTTVMIDRIMYLIHMNPEIKLSEIFMITFTNDAAQQMSNRLQDAFVTRYKLTKQQKYMRWVEEQSQMNVSTIHSFAYSLIKKLGIGEGFTRNLSIRTFEYEKKELIKDAVDEVIDSKKNIISQLGVPFYKANSIINDYWSVFSQLGVSHKGINEMDWGEPLDKESEKFHKIIKKMIPDLDKDYLDIERQADAVSLNELIRSLQGILVSGDIPENDLSMKYLFIDEFQDTDLSQINVACLLSKLLGAILFVVGDVKQSIYRFRGATEHAFIMFDRNIEEMGLQKPVKFTLINNYRTSATVMNRLDDYFMSWAQDGYLQYDKSVIPFNRGAGKIRMIPAVEAAEGEKDLKDKQIAEVVSAELDAHIERVKASNKPITEKNRVVILTRSNKELNDVGAVLRKAKIPASVKRDGHFYTSEAVRDFYTMVTSFMFCDEPKYIFSYLLTPYAGEIERMDVNAMERLNGNYDDLVAYVNHFLDQTSWKEYHKQLRLRPVLSVFKDMLDETPIIDNFISLNKLRRKNEEWEEKRINADSFTRARQYKANLEKLMEILQNNFSLDKVSLYDVYNFLKLNIATNRSEGEVDVQSKDDYTSVLCMTVHKSKGLEFDSVIIPYTNEKFAHGKQTKLLVNPLDNTVGWYYSGDRDKTKKKHKYNPMESEYFDSMFNADVRNNCLEGVRILYVGMTRAINTLVCIVDTDPRGGMTWGNLIDEVGVDYE